MEKRINCWEFSLCGREVGGFKARELGVCPAALSGDRQGLNHGTARGRVCWTVDGTACSGSLGRKFFKCLECPFFHEVERQEGRRFVLGLGGSRVR
ncbi:MAG: two-CW domain-containing protein [Planctomycetota bacterium]